MENPRAGAEIKTKTNKQKLNKVIRANLQIL